MLIFSSLGLSLIDTMLMEVICAIIVFIIFFIISVNFLQEHHEKKLPRVLRDWKFLPKPLRTLETIDYVVQTYMEVCSLHRKMILMIYSKVYCCCFVRRTVAAVPVIGYSGAKSDSLFGINLSGGQHMEVVKIDRTRV